MANLTSKELTALEDQLGMEQLLIKKYRSVAAMSADPQIRSKCEQIASRHQEHFNKLMGHLN
ncbi:MAG TPA: spore coat protein [Ruminococcaceae bacterium]|nr:spore coat protein [Oscillospiraceae bacterium]